MFTTETLPTGPAEIVPILRKINTLAREYAIHPFVRQYALFLVRNITDPERQADRVLSFVRDNVQHVGDPWGVEYLITPDRLLRKIATSGKAAGDCDDAVLLLNSLLLSIGIQAEAIGAMVHTTEKFDHCMSVRVTADGGIRKLDPSDRGNTIIRYHDFYVLENSPFSGLVN